jgi:hypothetical protein
MRLDARGGGKLANAIVRLLWRLENGLRAGGRRQNQKSEESCGDETQRPRTQSRWLHRNR